MAYIMKHFVRAIEYKLWLLLGYLALSLAAHLIVGTATAKPATGLWWLVSLVIGFTLPDVFWGKGTEILSPLYQQIPRKPLELLAGHFTVASGYVLLFLVAYTSFPWYGVGLMPDGFSWLVALNILSLSLYTTALGLTVMGVSFVFAVGKDRWPKVVAFVGVGLVGYLLPFHAGPGILTLRELALSPLGLATCGEIIRSNFGLHAPWNIAVTNVAHVSFLLIFQIGILNYVLTGKMDVG